MANVQHVPTITITEKLFSIVQMVDQDFQVKLNEHGCFFKYFQNKYRLVIAKGNKNERMFSLNVNMTKANMTMYAQGTSVIEDVDMWHKWIGHVNLQRLKSMQTQGIVIGLPNFKMFGMQKICEACQL